jgi:DNA-binding NarL/FixJ family response regulator
MSAIRVLLVEDHETVRQGLRMLLDSQPDIEVVGESANGRIALQDCERLKPHVVVMDLSMPEMNGLIATQSIKQTRPEIAVVVLTRYDDTAFVDVLKKAGVSGYVLKQSPSRELVEAVRAVSSGGSHFDTSLAGRAARMERETIERKPRVPSVSDREKHVLRMMAIGHSNKEIASDLDISVRTVEVHKANAMRKLKLRGRIDVVRYAILHGWLQEP